MSSQIEVEDGTGRLAEIFAMIKQYNGHHRADFDKALHVLRNELDEERRLHVKLSSMSTEEFETIKEHLAAFATTNSQDIIQVEEEVETIHQELVRLITENQKLGTQSDELRDLLTDSEPCKIVYKIKDIHAKIEESLTFLKDSGRMGPNIDRIFLASAPQQYPDGSQKDRAAKSGYDLRKTHPELPSGFYWIQNNDMEKPRQMYVDMEKEGGGYDFLLFEGDAITAVSKGKKAVPGLDLVYPRSKEHLAAMLAFLAHESIPVQAAMRTCGGVHRTTGSGSYAAYTMNSASGIPDWKVPDGGRWWLSDSPYSEPNGDYAYGGLLSLEGISEDGTITRFNDAHGVSTGTKYLLSTNAHP